MGKKNAGNIPVNTFGDETGTGISIERIALADMPELSQWQQPERHDRHSFFLLETGSVTMTIDFEQYNFHSPAIIYLHPDQVHHILGFENVSVCALAVADERLTPAYLELLDDINPAMPLSLNPEAAAQLEETASFCIKITQRKKEQLYLSLLQNAANIFVGLVISSYLEKQEMSENLSRAEQVTKSFRRVLALHFNQFKRPADYAERLNFSTAYLNECVKSTTGHPVSWHIQQRVILEAKRLLYHSGCSLKEIAAVLGYDDYSYFSRLFSKVSGTNPAAFRPKNHE